MSPDDIDSLVLDLSDFLQKQLQCDIDENADYEALSDFMFKALDKFITRERSYN